MGDEHKKPPTVHSVVVLSFVLPSSKQQRSRRCGVWENWRFSSFWRWPSVAVELPLRLMNPTRRNLKNSLVPELIHELYKQLNYTTYQTVVTNRFLLLRLSQLMNIKLYFGLMIFTYRKNSDRCYFYLIICYLVARWIRSIISSIRMTLA